MSADARNESRFGRMIQPPFPRPRALAFVCGLSASPILTQRVVGDVCMSATHTSKCVKSYSQENSASHWLKCYGAVDCPKKCNAKVYVAQGKRWSRKEQGGR